MKPKLLKVQVNGTEVEVCEVKDGKPVAVHSDGREVPFDMVHAVDTIKKVSDERDEARTKLTETSKLFEGLDAQAAREAIEKLKKIDEKKLIDAGQVDTVKAEAQRALQEQLDKQKNDYEAKLQGSQSVIRKLSIGNQFATSKLFNGEEATFILPPVVAESYFGKYLDVDANGSFVAYYDEAKKQPIFSRERPGENASFEEAITALADRDPNKDRFTRASGSGGSGAPAPTGGKPGGKTMQRSQFNALPPGEQMKFVKDGGQVSG